MTRYNIVQPNIEKLNTLLKQLKFIGHKVVVYSMFTINYTT